MTAVHRPALGAALLAVAGIAALPGVDDARAAEGDPARAPAGEVTRPGDLLKEADGLEVRFGYFPSAGKIRLLVLGAPEPFTRWEGSLSKPPGGRGNEIQQLKDPVGMRWRGGSICPAAWVNSRRQ